MFACEYCFCAYLSPQSFVIVTCDGTVQGGFLFLETKALETFIRCFSSYLHCLQWLSDIVSTVHSFDGNSEKHRRDVDITRLNVQCAKDNIQEPLHMSPQAKRAHMEAFTLGVSKFSTVLFIEDEKGTSAHCL